MRASRLLPSLGLVIAFVLAPSGPADADENRHSRFRGTQAFDVRDTGWTSVPLQGEILAHGDVDLAIIGPHGEELDGHLADRSHQGFYLPLYNVDRIENGWRLYMDLGSGAPSHDRIRFRVGERVAAEGCVLESSEDLETWHRLAEGDLFRVGEGEGLESLILDYPSTTHRYLRLDWPIESLPHLQRIEVFELDDSETRSAIDTDQCWARAGRRVCRLTLPKASHRVRRLDLEVESDGPWGYRLLLPDQGRWRAAASGIRAHGGLSNLGLDGVSPRRYSRFALLELYAEEQPPEPKSASFAVAGADLTFRAENIGVHRVAWGRSAPSKPLQYRNPPERASRLRFFEEPEIGPWPALPETLVGLAAALPDTLALAEWPIEVEGAKPGDVIRLRLPFDWSSIAGPDVAPGQPYLAIGEKQLPYLKVEPNEPETLVDDHGTPLKSQLDSRFSDIMLPIEAPASHASEGSRWPDSEGAVEEKEALPVSIQLMLFANGPFERSVSVSWQRSGRPGIDALWTTLVPRTPWRCLEPNPLPCALSLEGRSFPPEPVAIEFEDGNDAPLPGLHITAHVPREELLFVWPEGAPPVLRLYEGSSKPSGYDMEVLEPALRLRPAIWASLGAPVLDRREVSMPAWVLPAILALAVLVLGWLLARLVRSEDA